MARFGRVAIFPLTESVRQREVAGQFLGRSISRYFSIGLLLFTLYAAFSYASDALLQSNNATVNFCLENLYVRCKST